MKKKLVILSGAGVSAESGVQTFRGGNGLWDGHKVEDVASPRGWNMNQQLVLDFYNKRRSELLTVEPNDAHMIIAELEKDFDVQIITQNVDDLHERAGSTNVLHLHGELLKARSTVKEDYVIDWFGDMTEDDIDDEGDQLRPHIVWFGEDVPMMNTAIRTIKTADIVIIIGTSMQVYPAANLVFHTHAPDIYYVDPDPAKVDDIELNYIKASATKGMKKLKKLLMKNRVND
jgi:NAD-dependent deacetylase